jgi:membrane-bound serine protease (ClpP class)
MTKLLLAIVAAILGCASGRADAAPAPVLVVPLAGAIGPASADFVGRSLSRGADENAQLIVLQIDTPGGLDRSMRQIIQDILASPVPVAAFVAPSGARAASAGTYILYASHVAAMAPGTNLGAATPVSIGMPSSPSPAPATPASKPSDAGKPDKTDGGQAADEGTMTKKAVHDAAAYIRSLAQLRGRNVEWAERAVRESVSLSADEALAQHVIDLTARDVPELLTKLNGRKLVTAGGERILATSGAATTTVAPDWRTRFLAIITDPSVALMLLMAGIYGLFFEFWNPGLALPGVLGAICLLLGLFALQMLPVNYAGLALVLLGIAFIVAETFLPAYGSLGVGGIVAFAIGAVMLIDTDVPGFGVPYWLIATLAAITGLFVFFVAGAAVKARRRPIVTGHEQLIGSIGVALDDLETEGWARIHSEQWRVTSPVPIKRGQRVRVTARSDLLLSVLPVTEADQGA